MNSLYRFLTVLQKKMAGRLAHRRLENRILLAFAGISLLLAVIGWRSLEDNRAYIAAEQRINVIYQQLRALNRMLLTLQDAETGQRGFLLTNRDEYLEPYANSLREADQALTDLRQAFDSEAHGHAALPEIARLKAEKFDELARTVRLNGQGRRNEALALVNTGAGKQTMDQLRVLIGDLRRAKLSELETIRSASRERATRSRTSNNAFIGTILLFLLAAYTVLVHDLTERRRLRARLQFLDNHDGITGLPNRKLFIDLLQHHLKHAHRDHHQAALLLVNLDNFASVNDEFGYQTGDAVLTEVARRLRTTARQADAVARLWGDEFAVLVPQVHGMQELATFAQRLIDALSLPLIPGMRERYLGASVGIALYPNNAHAADPLLTQAREAARKARRDRQQRVRFFRDEDAAGTLDSRRNRLLDDLHRAVERHEFQVRYQPQIDMASGAVLGVEALLRWRHAEFGDIAPDEFIPLAEKSGLIFPIGARVLREACAQARRWGDAGLRWPVAVNVSPAELASPDFVNMVSQALVASGLEPVCLDIEVTERTLLDHDAMQALKRLRALGVQLSIDDFGIGYSSVSYLAQLPIQTIKIDKSFVIDLPHDERLCGVVRGLIGLGRELDIGIVAEGVETRDQADFLLKEGCRVGQGFLFSAPSDAATLERWATGER